MQKKANVVSELHLSVLQKEAKTAVDEMVEKVKAIVGDYIYSYDDEEMIDVVGKLLLDKKITIACAESCTGGLLREHLRMLQGFQKSSKEVM